MNRGTIRTKSRRKLDETSAVFWSDDELNDFIQDSFYYYWMWMIDAGHPITLKSTTHNIVASTATVALPSDWVKSRLIERDFGNYSVPCPWEERFERSNWTAGSTATVLDGYLPNIKFLGSNMVLEPTPAISATSGLKHDYYYIPTEFTSDSDTPTGPLGNMFAQLLINRTVLLAKEKEEGIVGSGADLGPTGQIIATWEQRFKSSIELPSAQRVYVEPFGI